MRTLELYSRDGCHLCDELAAELAPVIRGRARLTIVDIDEDVELVRRYGLRIPVLVGDGRELSTFPLDVTAVEAYLKGSDG